jgi:hypothetical protein
VVHVCNPNYPGGRDQEDCGLKPAQGNSSPDPISNISNTKKGVAEDSKMATRGRKQKASLL